MPSDHPYASPADRFRDYSLPDRIRCHYTNIRGLRCEYRIADPSTGLCVLHQRQVVRKIEDRARTLADRLFQDAGTLKSREEVRGFIVELIRLLAEQRIDRHDAGVMAYGCALLLQTMPSRTVTQCEEETNRFIRRILVGSVPQEAEALLASPNQPDGHLSPAESSASSSSEQQLEESHHSERDRSAPRPQP